MLNKNGELLKQKLVSLSLPDRTDRLQTQKYNRDIFFLTTSFTFLCLSLFVFTPVFLFTCDACYLCIFLTLWSLCFSYSLWEPSTAQLQRSLQPTPVIIMTRMHHALLIYAQATVHPVLLCNNTEWIMCATERFWCCVRGRQFNRNCHCRQFQFLQHKYLARWHWKQL